MEESADKLLEINKEERRNNDESVGIVDDEGPIQYLNMEADDFNKMTIDELLDAAASLNGLAFQIQRFQSDNEAAANRLERHIDKSAAQTASTFEGYSWQERRWKAIVSSKILAGLDSELGKLKQKAEQHKYLATSINKLADTLNKKADIKNRRYRE